VTAAAVVVVVVVMIEGTSDLGVLLPVSEQQQRGHHHGVHDGRRAGVAADLHDGGAVQVEDRVQQPLQLLQPVTHGNTHWWIITHGNTHC